MVSLLYNNAEIELTKNLFHSRLYSKAGVESLLPPAFLFEYKLKLKQKRVNQFKICYYEN